MPRFFLILGLVIAAASLAVAVWLAGASGDFLPSSSETLMGSDIGDEERRALQTMTGLELAPSAVVHAYHFESALDQRLVALVSLSEKDTEALLAQPLFDGATWEPASDLPTPTSDLSGWPSSWGEHTTSGRRTTIDTAPGRQLGVSISGETFGPQTLQITWTTY